MTRYLVLFAVLTAMGLTLMAAVLAQYGYSLFDPEMRIMVAVGIAVSAYVAWRISTILKNRRNTLSDRPAPGGAGKSKLSALFGARDAAYEARAAALAARRKKLVEEGKLEPEEAPAPAPPPVPEGERPTRVAADAPIKDKMAARAERVRRAKAEGKLDPAEGAGNVQDSLRGAKNPKHIEKQVFGLVIAGAGAFALLAPWVMPMQGPTIWFYGLGFVMVFLGARYAFFDSALEEADEDFEEEIRKIPYADGSTQQSEASGQRDRAAADTSVEDRMAARAERVRRAKEEGKL